jgi:phosphoribosylamine-glycine ligase
MGDPAMLVDLMLLESSLTELLTMTAEGKLHTVHPSSANEFAAAVTIVTPNYPDENFNLTSPSPPLDGHYLWNGVTDEGIVLSSTTYDGSQLSINGGVVAVALARSVSIEIAIQKAYQLSSKLPGFDVRRDIGQHMKIPNFFA